MPKAIVQLGMLVQRDPRQKRRDKPTKLRIMHDLSYLALSQAGIHIDPFMQKPLGDKSLANLVGKIRFLEAHNTYIFQSTDPVAWRKVYPRGESPHKTPVLKCPAHQLDDPLSDLLHAGINMSADFQVLGNNNA